MKTRALTLTVGLAAAALAACSGTGPAPAGSTSSAGSVSPAPVSPKPTSTVPSTQAAAAFTMSTSVDNASSFHVTGTYTWPHARLKVNVGLLKTGQLAGTLVDDGDPMSAVDAAGQMYVKVTPGFLGYLGKSGECAALCGQYVVAKPSLASGLLDSMGMTQTETILENMAAAGPSMTSVAYHGQAAYRWSAPGYAAGSYIIVAATAQCYPLKVDVPGQFELTFSQWNQVPVPAKPAASKIHTGTW